MKRERVYLNCDAITVKPRDYNFGEGYPEAWEFFEAVSCEACGKPVYPVQGENRHREIDPDADCDGYLNADGPMMNYLYPLPGSRDRDPAELARAIVHLPLCVVKLEDEDDYALALTGGGMDLSWQICAAFVACGYWPPLHFCDLPRMAGRGTSRSDRSLIAKCRESSRIAARWAASTGANLRRNFPAPKREPRQRRAS